MAMYSAVPPPPELAADPAPASPLSALKSQANQSSTGVDIDAWTISALQSLSVSPVARGTGTPLAIAIDSEHPKRSVGFTPEATRTDVPRRPPSRRDSMKKRDAVLKGNEGSRQRRRWENDRLMHVPNAQPPEPRDWEVRATHTVHHIPYQLAQFWDVGVRQRVEDKTARLAAQRKKQQLKSGSATGLGAGEVPRDLRESAKRSPVVRSWVRALEEPVRGYLRARADEREQDLLDDSAAGEMDSDDEEIVFVGRSGAMRELNGKGGGGGWKRAHREVSHETVDSGMVFDSFGEGEGAAYKRWLTHAICDYYGLESKSVTLANPSRRVVYVGIKEGQRRPGSHLKHFPRPMWELC
ncbi:unnamed protein product [Clonostachys chloroleuca]|uniref:R3H-associated N-terminal domain-containing protein n=1 Tax=Clonostachys chloroleuca TaxID=1926264 RepID=A0AA35M4V4_9HYPO|nr:unnamed protein product [Clonostachys chloroleuca]